MVGSRQEPLERPVAEDVVARSRTRAVRGRPARALPPAGAASRISASTRVADGVAVGDVEQLRAELAHEREVDAVLEVGEWVASLPPSTAARAVADCVRRSWSSMITALPAQRPPTPVPLGRLGAAPWLVLPVRRSCSARATNDFAAPERGSAVDDRLAVGDRPRDGPVARHEHVGAAAEQPLDVGVADADVRVGAVEHERDACRVVAHLRQRLEPDLRVLQRQRVEHADEAEVRREVDRRDHLGRERRRRVDDHDVVARPQELEDRAQERDRDRRRLVGPQRREQRLRAGRMLGEEAVDLLAVERAARRPRGRRSSAPGRRPSASPTSPNCRSRSTITGRAPAMRERDREVARR